MIRHQDNKIICNECACFELPEEMRIDPHPETCPSEDEFHLVAPDGSFKLVIAVLTVEKSAKEFAEEIYEEREDMHIIEPLREIETGGGIKGYATHLGYSDEVVEEITLDLPCDQHALINIRLWRFKQSCDTKLYAQAWNKILTTARLLPNDSSQPNAAEKAAMDTYVRNRSNKPDPIAYTETFHSPSGTTHVRFPDITEEENERRMELLKKATVELVKDQLRRKRERKEREEEAKQQE